MSLIIAPKMCCVLRCALITLLVVAVWPLFWLTFFDGNYSEIKRHQLPKLNCTLVANDTIEVDCCTDCKRNTTTFICDDSGCINAVDDHKKCGMWNKDGQCIALQHDKCV